MDELTAELKRPLDKNNLGNDVAALNNLVAMMNNPDITGAVVPKGEQTKIIVDRPMNPADFQPQSISPAAKPEPIPPPKAPLVPSPAHNPGLGSRLFFTGHLCVGKDYCATQAGLAIHGFADPLYYLAQHFFGIPVNAVENKDKPGIREFLQTAGQWGRGTVNAQYPLNATRALFITMIRSLATAGVVNGFGIDWAQYGSTDEIWLNGLIKRLGDAKQVGITNVRFENEFKRLRAEGFRHFHIMCSPVTHAERLRARGLTLDSPAMKDTSEQLAAYLDADVRKKISAQRDGPKINAIWNDERVAAPSNRVYTMNQWLQQLAITA